MDQRTSQCRQDQAFNKTKMLCIVLILVPPSLQIRLLHLPLDKEVGPATSTSRPRTLSSQTHYPVQFAGVFSTINWARAVSTHTTWCHQDLDPVTRKPHFPSKPEIQTHLTQMILPWTCTLIVQSMILLTKLLLVGNGKRRVQFLQESKIVNISQCRCLKNGVVDWFSVLWWVWLDSVGFWSLSFRFWCLSRGAFLLSPHRVQGLCESVWVISCIFLSWLWFKESKFVLKLLFDASRTLHEWDILFIVWTLWYELKSRKSCYQVDHLLTMRGVTCFRY